MHRRSGIFMMSAILSSFVCRASDEVMDRRAAVVHLRETSAQWKQVETLHEEAQAKVRMARSATLPSLQIISRQYFARFDGIRYGLPQFIETSPVLAGSSGLELLWIPVDFGAFARSEAARLNQEASEKQVEHLRSDLTFLALFQYLGAQKLRHRLDFAGAAYERSREILKIAEARVKSGLGLSLDVMRAEGLLATEELRRLDLETHYQKALEELANTLGRSSSEGIKLAPLKFQAFQIKEQEPDLKTPTLEIQTTRTLVQAAQSMLDSARRERWPKLGVMGEIGYLGARSFLGLGPNSLNGSIALQISIPLYTGGRVDGKVQEEQARVRKAELQLEHLERQARSQMQMTVSQLRVADSAVRTVGKQVKAATEELRLMTRRFRSGTASGLELRTAYANLAAAHDTETEALFAFEAAKIQYFKLRSDVAGYLEASP